MSSRLFVTIREELALAYDVHSYVSHFQDAGSLVVSAGVDPKRVDPTVRAIRAELSRMDEGVRDGAAQGEGVHQGAHSAPDGGHRAVSSWAREPGAVARRCPDRRRDPGRDRSVTEEDVRRVSRDLSARAHALAIVGPYRARLASRSCSRERRVARGERRVGDSLARSRPSQLATRSVGSVAEPGTALGEEATLDGTPQPSRGRAGGAAVDAQVMLVVARQAGVIDVLETLVPPTFDAAARTERVASRRRVRSRASRSRRGARVQPDSQRYRRRRCCRSRPRTTGRARAT
jgi:hypothetical protein